MNYSKSSPILSMLTTNSHDHNTKANTKKRVLNILIADDDIEAAITLQEILEYRGHTVTIIDESPRCITTCCLNKYDLIFIDYQMQNLDGIQVVNIIKEYISKTLIFAYTKDNSTSTIQQFKICGMSGALVKPIDLTNINKTLDNLLKNIEARTKLDQEIIKKSPSKDLILFETNSPMISKSPLIY